MKFLEEHTTTKSNLYWIGVGVYLLFAFIVGVVVWKSEGYAENNDEVWWVWGFWFMYILLYVTSVGMIFGEIFDELKKTETYGPNFLKAILCIAPALLVLVLQLVISPSYRRDVLSLSVFAALNLFDGIEMLEIVLMQNEREDFDLDNNVEKCIIAFACLSFLVTSLGLTSGLTRYELDGHETVRVMTKLFVLAYARFYSQMCRFWAYEFMFGPIVVMKRRYLSRRI
jgi:hypothetical protein